MKRKINLFITTFLIVMVTISSQVATRQTVQAQDFYPPVLEPVLSEDGLTLLNAMPTLVILDDPDHSLQGVRIPPPEGFTNSPESATATFAFTFSPAGDKDPWGQSCIAFPAQAKTGFIYAGSIWGNLIKSSVPIKIKACWASLSGSTLGYSGGGPFHRNFSGATKTNTWYAGSLANSLAGSDLGPTNYDMYITYNKNFSWYYGTDGNTPPGKSDLVSVALHEIAHGLNYMGSMTVSGTKGSWGYGTPYPNIYDTFMKSGSGTALTNTSVYPNPSPALKTILTSNNIFFHGTNAMAANGGNKVKMYAPSTWAPGSSYSHLDYTTFKNTANRLMVYAISAGTSIHDPGTISKGLLKDLGWKSGTSNVPNPISPSGTIADKTPTYKWSKVTGATQYRIQVDKGATKVFDKTYPASACGASTCQGTPTNTLGYFAYRWKVQAYIGGAWKTYSPYMNFTVSGGGGGPKAGFWRDNPWWVEFYVTTNQASVANFAMYVDVTGCGVYKITHTTLEAIASNHFSFTGPFYASGTFDTTTSAHGTAGLTSFYIAGCGTVSTGTYSWTATWRNSNQPDIVGGSEGDIVIVLPNSEDHHYYTIEKIEP